MPSVSFPVRLVSVLHSTSPRGRRAGVDESGVPGGLWLTDTPRAASPRRARARPPGGPPVSKQAAEGLLHRTIIRERLCKLLIEDDDVRRFGHPLRMLAANQGAQI